MITVTVDTSEVDRYVAHLRGVKHSMAKELVPVMKRAAQNVKTATQADMRGSGNAGFRAIAGRVSYDNITGNQYGWSTKIGIDKGGAGNLGNIAVFGTYKGGGTRLHPSFHMEAELPVFEGYVLSAVEALL